MTKSTDLRERPGVGEATDGEDAYRDLRRSLGSLLAAERRLRGREQRGDGGLSHSHMRALFILTRQPEATAGTLAREAELNPASVTAMVDQLEGRGLVQRRRDSSDRRQSLISLTDAGRREVEEKERYWRAMMGEMLSDVTAGEIAAAIKTLDRITTVIERFAETEDDRGPDPRHSVGPSELRR